MKEMTAACNRVLEGLKIKAKCVSAARHRHLALYDLALEPGCRVRRIEMFAREIALGLKSKTNPIITSIPELGIVRLRVAYEDAAVLPFEDLYVEAEKPEGILPVLLGETDQGEKLWVDLALHPHTLVAGGTGSGKSTALHTIIANAVRNGDVWLYLVDPKGGVEFGVYSDNVATFLATTYDETIFMLQRLNAEMDRRYDMLFRAGLASIEQQPNAFSKILVVIDEVADLMMYDSNKQNAQRGSFERLLIMLAQKSRAAGIYIVLATQRPSVDILKGSIKANFPARLSCRVSSAVDSKVILDRSGAESLLGRGDAILDSNVHDCSRFQVAYTTKENVINLANA
jgi:S-DNA-T family DNA segregation ATPase FtsK/SpoIIIE